MTATRRDLSMVVMMTLMASACADDADGPDDAAATVNADSTGAPTDPTAAEETDGGSTDATEDPGTSGSEGEGEASTGDDPMIPAACEAVGLPQPPGPGTQVGHFTTVAAFDADTLERWLGEVPDPTAAILVLASRPEYDCDHLADLESSGVAQQTIIVFPGPIEVGTYVLGEQVRGLAWEWLGSGESGGTYERELEGQTLTITTADDACVSGILGLDADDEDGHGFAVDADASCG